MVLSDTSSHSNRRCAPSFERTKLTNPSLMTFTFIQSRARHSFSNGRHHLPTKVPFHFTHLWDADCMFLYFINHLDALPPSNIFPLRNEHLWRKQFHRELRHNSSSPRIMIGLFVVVFLLCFPVTGHSNSGNNLLAHHLTPARRNRGLLVI